jgi:hypothetical protein
MNIVYLGILFRTCDGNLRERSGRSRRGLRLRLGRGLRGRVLLADEEGSPALAETVHPEAVQDLLTLSGEKINK